MRNKVSWQLKRELYSEIIQVPDMLSDFPVDENAILEPPIWRMHIYFAIFFRAHFDLENVFKELFNKGRGL